MATTDEVRKVIAGSPNKSCDLDPIPTWLLKECVEELLPLVTDMVNDSLTTGLVPKDLKRAHIKPLIKKAGLDIDVFKNYRPVSNLSFLTKTVEKIVV